MKLQLWSHVGVASLILLCVAGCPTKDMPSDVDGKSNSFHHKGEASSPAFQGGAKEKSHLAGEVESRMQASVDRKIILTADIHLKVVDLAKGEGQLLQLVEEYQGYPSHTEVSGQTGNARHGIWQVRIPTKQYNAFCEAVKKLGELARYVSGAREVTEEYYDLQSRLKSKEAELEALRKILDKGGDKIDHVLAVQREFSRALTELEQMKGRQRVLDNLLELTTVTVRIDERDPFVPPTVVGPIDFGTSIGNAFFGSWKVLVAAGKGVVLAATVAAPWLPLIALLALAARSVWRRRRVAVASNGSGEVKSA